MLQSSMGNFKLDVRFGDRNSLPYYVGTLDRALLARADVGSIMHAGKVVTLRDSNRGITPGITSDTAVPMPYYALSGMDINNYPDVQRNRGMPGYLNLPTDTAINAPAAAQTAEGIGGPGSPGWPGIPNTAAAYNGEAVAGGFGTIQMAPSLELSTTAFAFDSTDNAFYSLIGLTGIATTAAYAPGTALTALCYANVTPAVTSQVASVGLLIPVQNPTDVVVGRVAPAGVFVGPEGYLTLAFKPEFAAGTTINVLTAASTITGNVAPGVPVP